MSRGDPWFFSLVERLRQQARQQTDTSGTDRRITQAFVDAYYADLDPIFLVILLCPHIRLDVNAFDDMDVTTFMRYLAVSDAYFAMERVKHENS